MKIEVCKYRKIILKLTDGEVASIIRDLELAKSEWNLSDDGKKFLDLLRK